MLSTTWSRREAGEADEVEDGPERLAGEPADAVDLDQGRRDEAAVRVALVERALVEQAAGLAHAGDVPEQVLPGRLVDDGPDVGRELARVADLQLGHGTLEHLHDLRCHVLLEEEDAQGRAALASRAEGALDRVGDHLLGQGRAVDDHGVEAAGLGDEGADRGVARRHRTGDGPGGLGAAGERHTGDAGVGDERRSDRAALAGQQDQCVRRHARLVQQVHDRGGGQRGGLGGLGDDAVAGGEGGCELAGEDGEREVPGADGDEHAARVQLQPVLLAGGAGEAGGLGQEAAGLGGVVVEEVDRLAPVGDRIGDGAAALAAAEIEEAAGVRGQEVGRTVEDGGALRHGDVAPAREAGLGAGDGALGGGDVGEVDLAQRRGGDRTGRAPHGGRACRQGRRGGPSSWIRQPR